MDRPSSRRTRDHHQRRSHPSAPGTLRGVGGGTTGQQQQQQQQLTSGGNYSSTDSDNEGAAVYESLTPVIRRPLPHSHSALVPLSGDLTRLYNGNPHGMAPRIMDPAAMQDTKGVRTTNLDADEHSPLATSTGTGTTRKDFAAAKIYQLLNFSPETASPETDDLNSETSNEHNVSDCPTLPVHGSSQGGSYMNPSTASDISCNALNNHPLYQYGVQQLSVQHLHNPFLTGSFNSAAHLHHHQLHRPSIYCSNHDSHLLDDQHQDKHASASSPTTTSSDRCLLPTSSSGNICKMSGNNSAMLQYNPSMQSHPHADRARPLSEHYHASSIIRTPQCPLHTGPGGVLQPYPARTNLRPGSTVKPSQKTRGLKRVLTWRTLTMILILLCLALVAALVYFAVAAGSHRPDDLTRCSRAQEVISRSQFENGPVSRVKRDAELSNSVLSQEFNTDGNFSIEGNSSVGFLKLGKTGAIKDGELWPNSSSAYNEIGDFLRLDFIETGDSTVAGEESENLTTVPSLTEAPTNYTLSLNENVTFTTIPPKGHSSFKNNASLLNSEQSDAPRVREARGHSTAKDQTFTILQTVLLSHYIDLNGIRQPQLILETPKVLSRDDLRVVLSRPGRDVVDDDHWNVIQKGFAETGYSDGDQFVELTPGLTTEITLPPRGFWLGRTTQKRTGTVMLNLTISSAATIIMYGRRNLPPTHAEYSFTHTLRTSAQRTRRDATDSRVFHQNLELGDWYFGLYNDKGKEESATFSVSEVETSYCENECNGQGSCIDGQCQCLAGFGGADCSQTVCPLLCSGHGKYSQGGCQCFPGWKGGSCDIPEFQCDDPTCGGRGKCWSGKCVCDAPFAGSRCETVQCPRDCNQHGICQNGTCFCQPGWIGVLCDLPVNDSRRLCSNHGSLNARTQKCECDARWTGDSCSTEVCSPPCGANGECQNSRCVCADGWNGLICTDPACPPCGPHGKCSNGTCVCDQGWSGRICTADNCPNACGRHGTCVQEGTAWKCQCEASWKGDGCATETERCDDNRDNDGDGLTDCADNDCCSADVCLSHVNCLVSPEPQEVLLRDQAIPDTASFFDRVKFLIRESGVQSYVDRNAFDPKRVSVLRGRVVDSGDVGLAGVRVSIQAPLGETSPWGFTTTRRDGMFDLLFNGGGSNIVNFQKNNYRDSSSSAILAWNEFGVVDTVKMFRESELSGQNRVGFLPPTNDGGPACELSSLRFQPQLYPFWKHFPSGGQGRGPAVYFEAQVLQESFNISGSDIRLNHISSRSSGFSSLLLVTLTAESIVSGLNRVIIRVSNAGLQEETVYDARPNLSHVYAWNGTNAYDQLVYGFSTVKVSVGYEGRNCRDVFWAHQTAKMKGRDVPVSDIGSWDLSVHHRYNTEASILHSGDGSNLYFMEGILDVKPVAGTGQLRPVICRDNCAASSAASADLLAPVALASGPDGSLFIGDFNLIRWLKPDKSIVTVLQLPSPASLQKYFLAVNPSNGQLYVSLSQLLKVIRVTSLSSPVDIANNFATVVGNGMPCVPRAGVFSCGENVAATAASMIFPKGIAFDKTGSLYIADGGAIRFVDQAGTIKTLVPQTPYSTTWIPVQCGAAIQLDQLNLRWPTGLAVSPIDDSLAVIDDNMLIKLSRTRKIAEVIAGGSLKCAGEMLDNPAGVTVSQSGAVFVTESGTESWKIRRVDGDSSRVVLSSCNCSDSTAGCDCVPVKRGAENLLMPGAMAVGANDVLYVADFKALKIFSVAPAVPRQNANMEIEIEHPDNGEVYTFSRYGLHQETRDLLTGQLKYKFRYNVDTIFGKIVSVADRDGKTCVIARDYRGQVNSLECERWKTGLTTTPRGLLKDAKSSDGSEVNFAYDSDTGLIIGRTDTSARPFAYKHDQFGRLKEVIQSTGERIQWPTDFAIKILSDPEIMRSGSQGAVSLVRSSYVLLVSSDSNLSFSNWSAPANFFLRLTENNASFAGAVVYPKQASGRFRRSLKVNDSTLFSVEFDPATGDEVILDRDDAPVLTTKFDGVGRIVSLKPAMWDFSESKFTYDSAGRMVKWEHGSMSKMVDYNELGLPVLERRADGGSWKYMYNDKKKLIKITKGTGDQITLDYDATGGVRSITTPNGRTLIVREEALISFRRYSVRDSLAESSFSQDFNAQGHLIAFTRPSGVRKAVFTYTDNGHLQSVYFGRNTVTNAYNTNGMLEQVKKASDDLVTTTDITYFGGVLIDSVGSKYAGKVELEPVTTRYEYDNGLNLLRRKLQVGSSDVSVTDFTTDPRTRQITRFGPFSVSQSQLGATIVTDDNAIFMKQLNNLGKTYNHVLRLQHKIVASTEMIYNDMGQLSELKIRKGESAVDVSFSFKYDLNGQLIEANKNKQSFWAYSYDSNGNRGAASGSGDQVRNSTFGSRDEPNDPATVTDQDGFVVKKGETNYDYDARGQVTRVWNSSIDVKFHYDEQGRLIASQSSPTDVTQFIYADQSRKDTVTHIYQKKTRTLTQLFYDVSGQIIAMARDGNPYYVLQSQLTATVYDQFAKTVKEISFTPFGEVATDSNADFYYPFDQNHNLRDGLAKVVFHDGRAYDPESGRYLTPDFGDLRVMTLERLNPYLYQENDPLLSIGEKQPNLDASLWAKVLGVRNNLAVGNGVSLTSLLNLNCDLTASLPVINSACSVLPTVTDFSALTMLQSKQVKLPDVMSKTLQLSSTVPLYGRSTIITTTDNGTLDTATSGTGARTINDAIDFIISGAQMMPWHVSAGTREKFFLAKKGTIPTLDLDISRLRTAIPGVNFTSKREASDISLAVQSDSLVFNISYVRDTRESVGWFGDFFRDAAVQKAWDIEKFCVASGLSGGATAWTDADKTSLRAQGFVPGYTGQLSRDITVLPQLAGDPANVVFVRN